MAEPEVSFYDYIKNSGCEDALWRVLIDVDKLQNKLEDPVEYIRENLDSELTERYAILRQELTEAGEELLQLAEEYPKEFAKYLKIKKKKAKKRGLKKGELLPMEKALRTAMDLPTDILFSEEATTEAPTEATNEETFEGTFEDTNLEIRSLREDSPSRRDSVKSTLLIRYQHKEFEQSDQMLPEERYSEPELSEAEPSEVEWSETETLISARPILPTEPLAKTLELRITSEESQIPVHQESPPQPDIFEINRFEGDSIGIYSEPITEQSILTNENLPGEEAENLNDNFEDIQSVKQNKFLCC